MGHRRRIMGEAEPRRGDVNLPTGLFPGIHLGLEMHVHAGKDPEINQTQSLNQVSKTMGWRRPRRNAPRR